MIEVNAQEICRTRLCATPSCEWDAEAGSAFCFDCKRGKGQAGLRSLLGTTEPMPLRAERARAPRMRTASGDLTPRELAVLQSAAAGKTAKETAAELFLSPNTIKTHRQRACDKLDANGILHAVAIAYRRGLIG